MTRVRTTCGDPTVVVNVTVPLRVLPVVFACALNSTDEVLEPVDTFVLSQLMSAGLLIVHAVLVLAKMNWYPPSGGAAHVLGLRLIVGATRVALTVNLPVWVGTVVTSNRYVCPTVSTGEIRNWLLGALP